MTRRLLGPVGGPILFVLVAALVFGVLGWVTHSALKVEHAQREAAARAELGNNLRVALWRLDGRMLPAFGVEDSRPFYHYSPADPNDGYGVAATPLLITNLPDWMKLHFQLDAANGWESPQVLTADVAERVRLTWPDLPLRNVNPEREAMLGEIRKKYPAREMLEIFATRDRAIPADALSLAAPLLVGDSVPQPEPLPGPTPAPVVAPAPTTPSSNPVSPAVQSSAIPAPTRDSVRIFGLEICVRPTPTPTPTPTSQLANGFAQNQFRLDSENLGQSAPASQQVLSPMGGVAQGRGRTQTSKELDNTVGTTDTINRASTINRGMKDVQPPPGTAQPKGQGGYNNYTSNTGQLTNDLKVLMNQSSVQSVPAVGNTAGIPTNGMNPISSSPTIAGGQNQVGPSPLSAGNGGGSFGNPAGPLSATPSPALSPRASPLLPKGSSDDKEKDLGKLKKSDADGKNEIDKKTTRDLAKPMNDAFKKDESEQTFFYRLFDRSHNDRRYPVPRDEARTGTLSPPGAQTKMSEIERSIAPVVGMPPPVAPPTGISNPMSGDLVASANSPSGVPILPLAIHLGSMRPQWVIGTDGSEMLVLVRVAKVDNKTVCQGIILDWMKLEAMLQDEVKDLFPNAKLLPIKDPASVSPDRIMTALPIELDSGPQPELPPAGWTTLRLGLVLTWIAVIIAFAAVGFCGWTLIDLAERRIRFVSAVTHELRTPLTSLRLYLDLLVSGMVQDEAKKQEYLNTLATESDRLHRLIDNVLDFARLEKRRKDGDIKPIKVAELIEQLRQTWTDRLAQDGKELVVISTLPEGREVKTDAAMIQQIVGNLIDNARKYARDAVDRRIWVWAKPGAGNAVLIEVEDRGPGVPANERRTIFKPFRRGEQADSTAGGAGLGLALAKSWAEVLGGKLTYRLADGGTGACFRLELPVS